MELDQNECYCIENVFNREDARTGQRLLTLSSSESGPPSIHFRDVRFLPHGQKPRMLIIMNQAIVPNRPQ